MQNLSGFDPLLKDKEREVPLKEYFKGHGEDVHRKMKNKYGARADEVFYATANKTGMGWIVFTLLYVWLIFHLLGPLLP